MAGSYVRCSQTLPYAFIPLTSSTFYLFSVMNMTLRIAVSSVSISSELSNPRMVWGTPTLAAGVRSFGQTWQSGALCS